MSGRSEGEGMRQKGAGTKSKRGLTLGLIYKGMADRELLQCIKNSLVMLVPVLLVGAFALFFRSLPIPAYQNFLDQFMSGALDIFLGDIYAGTFGMLGIYTNVCVAISYMQSRLTTRTYGYGIVVTSLVCFFILSGIGSSEEFSIASLGAEGMFTAIVCALLASYLYDVIGKKMNRLALYFSDGADDAFYAMLSSIAPTVAVVLIFAGISVVLSQVFGVSSIQMLFTNILSRLFESRQRTLGTTLLFEFLSSVMWLFGIHGNNVLEPVAQSLYVPAVEINQAQIAQGLPAGEIYSKTFLDVFVLMGGCGTTWCLILALLIFGRRKSNRNLAKLAAVPGVLNISEIMIFGLPVVFNPVFMIPFLLVPIVCVLTSSLATQLGLVPIVVNQVEWTTPILLGGYLATGSIAGSVLQFVNLVLGVLIYAPFVRLFDEESTRNAKQKMDKLVHVLKESEESRKPITLLKLRNDAGVVAKILAQELQDMIDGGELTMYYQPQYDTQQNCIGAEALLRWKHPVYGMVYPPLTVKLAEETGRLLDLEEKVFQTVAENMKRLTAVLGENSRVSVNVTGSTIQLEEFERFLAQLKRDYPKACEHMAIEITEQAALLIDDELIERLTRIRNMGFELEIDDFSMGSTSIKYLQTNIFSLLKLDGSLSKDVLMNSRSRDIIASITKLSHDFGISVLAEYVENEEQRRALESVECRLYQGYLYSPAVPLEELEEKYRNGKI